MKKSLIKVLSLVSGMFFGTFPALTANTVTLSDIIGNPGEEVSVKVNLTSTEDIFALQFNANLGEGTTTIDGSAKTIGRASELSASCGTKDGETTLMVYSLDMSPIVAGSGEIAEFSILLGNSPGILTPQITVKASDSTGREIDCSTSGLSITINGATAEYPSGWVYDYGKVPINNTYLMEIPVENTGSSPLIINSIKFSSEELVCNSELPFTIEGGKTKKIEIGYFPRKRGNFSETATIESNSSTTDNVLRLLAAPYAVNEIRIGNVSGESDSEIEIPISVDNMDDILGFSLEFQLPSSLEYIEDSFKLSDRAQDHSVASSFNSGKLSVTAFSLSNTPFTGNNGVIGSFKVRLNGKNSVTLKPSKGVLTAIIDEKVTDVTSAIYSGTISIFYPSLSLSSQNVSLGRTPVSEEASTTLTIRNYGSSSLIIERIESELDNIHFNVNFPLTIEKSQNTILTITHTGNEEGKFEGMFKIYSNDPSQRLVNVKMTGEKYSPNFLSMEIYPVDKPSGETMVQVLLDNWEPVGGIQFDMIIPEGFEPINATSDVRAEGFSISSRRIDENTVRYLCYSLSGDFISQGQGGIFNLTYGFSEETLPGNYIFTLQNVKISDSSGQNRSSMIEDENAILIIVESFPVTEIIIDRIDRELEVNETVALSVTVLPENATDKTIEWSSSDPSVATVSNEGVVTPISGGAVTITATSKDGSGVQDSITITIKKSLKGDSNDDGILNVTDVVASINYALGKNGFDYFDKNMDMNDDGVLNITDVVILINVVLSGVSDSYSALEKIQPEYEKAGYLISDSKDLIESNGTVELPVSLNAEHEIVALQADITMENAGSISDLKLNDSMAGYEIAWKRISNNTVRFIIYHPENSIIPHNDTLFTITINNNHSCKNPLSISNIVASDTEANGYSLSFNDEEYGCVEILNHNTSSLYVGKDYVGINNAEGMDIYIYSLDGKFIKHIISNNPSEKIFLTPGFYIIRIEDEIRKISIGS